MNVSEIREELKKINDLVDKGVNGESVRVPYHYITPDQYDSRDDREADTNRSADLDFDWLRETLEECLEKLSHPYFESLLLKEELLTALEEEGVKDWDGYQKAHEKVF